MLESIDKKSGVPLYEQLYNDIKRDILSGKLVEGERLPSKRQISERLGVSVITVENAYSQLIAEGYVRAAQRSGYFVHYSGDAVSEVLEKPVPEPEDNIEPQREPASESAESSVFPFSVWSRLMRSVILEKGTALLRPVRHGGAEELCTAISDYLYRARGFYVPPRQIIVGSGTEYLYNLLIQLLGRDKSYGIENPCFEKLPKIYSLGGVHFERICLDSEGISLSQLEQSGVSIAHISPAHHYPTGIVMPISRRRGIMRWAEQESGRFIIEDDYDGEFRWSGKPVPTMFGSDSAGRVIYINTFSQTIAPSVRISYMCLPRQLYDLWEERMGFYSCTVPSFEQYTLARFISEGYFERHVSRLKKHYRRIREMVLELVKSFGGVTVNDGGSLSGLHFTIEAKRSFEEMEQLCSDCGIRLTKISDYYADPKQAPAGCFVVHYAAAQEDKLISALEKIGSAKQ